MSSPQPSQLPTSQEIEAVILAATNNLTITGQPLKDTRTQVFVGNLPYRVRWQDLKDLFRSPPPTPSSEFHHHPHPSPQLQESRVTNTVLRADVSLGPDNRSRGYGTVLLATKEDADRCINLLDGYCWMGRVLEVRVDRLVASPSAAMFPGGVSGVGVGTTPPPPPLQQQQQQMQGMGKTLYLTNIPPQTQWTSLKDLLRALQITVIRVDLSLSSSSSSLPSSSSPSTSWAKVIVASSNDVRRAIGGLDGIEYMGYVLRVRTEEELVQLQTSLLQQEQNVSEAAMVPIPPSQSQSPIPSIGGSGRRSVPPPLPLAALAPGSGSPPREKEKDRDSSSNTSSGSAETTRSNSSRHHLPPHLRHHHHHQPHPHPQHPGPISLPLSVLTHPHPHPHHPYSPLHHPSQTQLGLPPLTPSMPSFQFSGTTSGTPLQPHFLSPGIGIGGGNGTPGGGSGNGWGRTPGGWGMMMLGGMGSPPIMQQQSPMHHPQPGDYFQPPMIPSPYQQPPPQQQPEYFPPVPPPPPPPNSLLTSPDPSLTSFDPSSSISGSSPSSISGLTTDDGSGGSPGISQNTSSIATSLSSSASSSFSSPGEGQGSQVEGGKSTMTRTTSDPLTTTSTSSEVSAPGLPSPPSSPRHPPPPLKKKDHPRFKESEFANILSGGAFASLNLGGVGGVGGTTPLGQRRNSWTPGTERGPVF